MAPHQPLIVCSSPLFGLPLFVLSWNCKYARKAIVLHLAVGFALVTFNTKSFFSSCAPHPQETRRGALSPLNHSWPSFCMYTWYQCLRFQGFSMWLFVARNVPV